MIDGRPATRAAQIIAEAAANGLDPMAVLATRAYEDSSILAELRTDVRDNGKTWDWHTRLSGGREEEQ